MSKAVLIVDDSLTMRKLLSKTLQAAGFSVVEAPNGKEALSRLGEHSVQLIITDVNMPVMDGLEFLSELRRLANHRFTPVVVLTTESDAGKREQARAAGATGWIVKPFHPDKVMSVVQRIVQ